MKPISLFVRTIALVGLLAGAASAQVTDQQFSDLMGRYLQGEAGQQALGKTVEGFFQKRQQEMMKKQQDQEKTDFESQFKSPVKVDAGASPAKGPATAKVTIIEFSDFQCPYCKRGHDTMDEVLKAYPNDVKLVFKHLPLPFHKEAGPAAKAAYAAGKQNKFWEYHDALFANQSRLGAAYYEEVAKNLGLNMEKWKKDMASPEAEKQIEADKAIAEANSIQGTPGFFVNGVAVKGAYPFDHFKTIIDRWLNEGKAEGKDK